MIYLESSNPFILKPDREGIFEVLFKVSEIIQTKLRLVAVLSVILVSLQSRFLNRRLICLNPSKPFLSEKRYN